MNTTLNSIVSEFETTDKEASYTSWLIAKTNHSLADNSPCIPHDAVMADVEMIISNAEANHLKTA